MSGNAITSGRQQERTLSRIGRKPIPLPSGVQVEVGYGEVTVKGPMGTLTQTYHPEVEVRVENGEVVVERLKETQAAGINHVFGTFGFPGLPHEKVMRSIELFATQVMPHFQEAKVR